MNECHPGEFPADGQFRRDAEGDPAGELRACKFSLYLGWTWEHNRSWHRPSQCSSPKGGPLEKTARRSFRNRANRTGGSTCGRGDTSVRVWDEDDQAFKTTAPTEP